MIRATASRNSSPQFFAAALFLLGSALAHAQFVGPAPFTSNPPAAPTLIVPSPDKLASMSLLPGDVFQVQVFGVPQFDYRGRLNDDGDVALPLVGTLHLEGDTIIAAEQKIAARLVAAQIVKNPQVIVQVVESPNHFATVTGEVRNPGPIAIYGEKRLLDVLSAAGGLTPVASPLLTIYRRGSETPFQLQLPSDAAASGRYNIVISPGDNIVVSKVGVVYVVGAFHQQGAIPLKNTSPLTLIEAMSMAGGVNYEAALGKAYILRVSQDGRREIRFNVSAVLNHRVPDIALQSDDIVLIPTNNMKAALKGGAAGVASSFLAGIGYLTVR
jgi:polysaccharide export outer membrane protein